MTFGLGNTGRKELQPLKEASTTKTSKDVKPFNINIPD